MAISRKVLDEATASLTALKQVDAADIEWSPHAVSQVLDRPGLHHSYVEDMVARPYGDVYRDSGTNKLVLYDPDRETPTGKPRAVVVVVDHGKAVIVTAYNVDDWRRKEFENEDGYEWIGSLL